MRRGARDMIGGCARPIPSRIGLGGQRENGKRNRGDEECGETVLAPGHRKVLSSIDCAQSERDDPDVNARPA
jgi:hypothetical protein